MDKLEEDLAYISNLPLANQNSITNLNLALAQLEQDLRNFVYDKSAYEKIINVLVDLLKSIPITNFETGELVGKLERINNVLNLKLPGRGSTAKISLKQKTEPVQKELVPICK